MKQKTRGAKRRKYDASFKEEVFKMINNGRPAGEVAQSLGIEENLIYKWKSRSNQQQKPAIVSNENSPLVLTQDYQPLLKRTPEQEHDILKEGLIVDYDRGGQYAANKFRTPIHSIPGVLQNNGLSIKKSVLWSLIDSMFGIHPVY